MPNDNELLELLRSIKKDTDHIDIIQRDIEELKQFKDEFEKKTIYTVQNNNSLSDFFKKLSKDETINYLNSSDNRKNLIVLIKEIFVSELNLRLVKILGWQAGIFTALFIAYVKLWVE